MPSRLQSGNAFGPQLLSASSNFQGTLMGSATLKCKMKTRKGSELYGLLTVIHSPELFK
jgi:hypothetical protein